MKPMYIASCSFGKDSIATILLALEKGEPLDRIVFSEVMFDNSRDISAEMPEHIEWIYNVAIPRLGSLGVPTQVVRSKKDYVGLCRQVLKKGEKAGQMYGVQNSNPCFANSECKLAPIHTLLRRLEKEYDITKYVGIAIDEPVRLKRLEGSNKISLLTKYGYTEAMAMEKCKEYNLVSPIYSIGQRGGCWFCCNAPLSRYIKIRKDHPDYWESLRSLYYETNSKAFKYNKTFAEVEKEMNGLESLNKIQQTLF